MESIEPILGGLYPIRTVSALTGVNPVTLRAWERRYGLIRPQRTPKGHRLYSAEDVGTIENILKLIDRGIPIGQIRRILSDTPEAVAGAATATAYRGDPWEDYRQRMVRAVARYDERTLDAAYNDALSLYPLDLVARSLILPLFQELRSRHPDPPDHQAQLQFLRTYLRNKLGARFQHQAAQTNGPRLLAACLPGEQGEVELLLFALAAATKGLRLVLLGADMPLEPLAPAVSRSGCKGLVLFATGEPPSGLIETRLPRLARALEVPLILAGAALAAHQEALESAGIRVLAPDTAVALRQIREQLRAGL